MRNPWLAKNPFLSAWLSAANRAAGSARGQAAAAVKREVASAQKTGSRQLLDFWSGSLAPAPAAPKRRKKKR